MNPAIGVVCPANATKIRDGYRSILTPLIKVCVTCNDGARVSRDSVGSFGSESGFFIGKLGRLPDEFTASRFLTLRRSAITVKPGQIEHRDEARALRELQERLWWASCDQLQLVCAVEHFDPE